MSDAFDRFVKKEYAAAKAAGRLDLEREKRTWLEKLDALYSMVESCLADHMKEGRISVSYMETTLTEALLGRYPVRELRITIGTQHIRLEPSGTFLIGARGGVDMRGIRGEASLLLVPPEAIRPNVSIGFIDDGEPPEAPDAWVWKLATPYPNVMYIDLVPELFLEVLMGVSGCLSE